MTNGLIVYATLGAAVGCGLVAGVFFAFSTFVMKGLARLPTAQGIAAMQSINVTALTPTFMTALFGVATICLLLTVSALASWQKPGAFYLLAGGLLYLIGNIVVTIICNVPRNNALASIDPNSAQSAALWMNFYSGWIAWNHVRTVTALAASAAYMLALLRMGRG